MGLEILNSRGIKYALYDLSTNKFTAKKFKFSDKLLLKFISIINFLFVRMKDKFLELDLRLEGELHLLSYPYKEKAVLFMLIDKNSDYLFIKQEIKEILN